MILLSRILELRVKVTKQQHIWNRLIHKFFWLTELKESVSLNDLLDILHISFEGEQGHFDLF